MKGEDGKETRKPDTYGKGCPARGTLPFAVKNADMTGLLKLQTRQEEKGIITLLL